MIASHKDFEYENYNAVTFFASHAKNLKMTVKTITLKSSGEIIPVVHMEYDVNVTGKHVNINMFPYYDAKEEDLKNIPTTVSDIRFKMGYIIVYDRKLMRSVIKTSDPYWLVLNPGKSDEFRLSGEKRESYGGDVDSVSNAERFLKYYLFFDTETTGTPNNYGKPTSDTQNWPHIVQLSWIIEDIYGHIISKENHIIKPTDFIIPAASVAIHGITTERANKDGEPLSFVLDKFLKDVKESVVLVGHNVEFDIKVVGCESFRTYGVDLLEWKPFRDTMKESTDFCAIPPIIRGHYKWPTLQELHKKLFDRRFSEAHNSYTDVGATENCFWELVHRGIIER